MNKRSIDWALIGGVTVLSILLAGLASLVIYAVATEGEPSTIHVRCVGKYLVFESVDSGDIEIAGPCSK